LSSGGGIRTRDLRVMRPPEGGHPRPATPWQCGSGALRSAQIRSTWNHEWHHGVLRPGSRTPPHRVPEVTGYGAVYANCHGCTCQPYRTRPTNSTSARVSIENRGSWGAGSTTTSTPMLVSRATFSETDWRSRLFVLRRSSRTSSKRPARRGRVVPRRAGERRLRRQTRRARSVGRACPPRPPGPPVTLRQRIPGDLGDAAIVYRLMTPVPDHWVPFVAVPMRGPGAIELELPRCCTSETTAPPTGRTRSACCSEARPMRIRGPTACGSPKERSRERGRRDQARPARADALRRDRSLGRTPQAHGRGRGVERSALRHRHAPRQAFSSCGPAPPAPTGLRPGLPESAIRAPGPDRRAL
jgi:hypothetical protein